MVLSSAIVIAGSQTIAEVCFHMIADDRRPYCDLRSAIRDHLETSLYSQSTSRVTGITENEMQIRVPLCNVRHLNGILNTSLKIFSKKTH